MNFVSHDGSINTEAMFVCSCPYEIRQYCYEDIRVCQEQNYYVTYWKVKHYVKFWKHKKIQSRILLQQSDYILSVFPKGFLQAFLSLGYLRVYFKKKKLITKSQNRNYVDKITFTNDFQIILKGQAELNLATADWESERFTYERGTIPPFQLYNFITKSFTVCDVGGLSENSYEYCPVNDIILIPSGNWKTNQISVWGVPQRKVINQVQVQQALYEFEIKMTQSGQYFVVRDYRLNTFNIFSYGKKITFQKKISNLKLKLTKSWYIDWMQDHQYILLSCFYESIQYKILENSNEIIDCDLQKSNALKGKQQLIHQQKNSGNRQIINVKDVPNQKIHIIKRRRGEFIDYYQIML